MSLAARQSEAPVTGYKLVDQALEYVCGLAWEPIDDLERARIARAHRSAVRSAEIEDSFQEPDEIALFQALHDLRCPQEMRKLAVKKYWDLRDASRRGPAKDGSDQVSKPADPYVYPGTSVLINLRDHRDPAEAGKFERETATANSADPIDNFTADLNGLKSVHETLFKGVYEWAGKTRADPITINVQAIEQNPNAVLTKGDFQSGPASLTEHALPAELDKVKSGLDQSFSSGTLTKAEWSKATADQVGAINYVHAFRDGNGRAMRGFIEHSAKAYGYETDTSQFTKAEWMTHSHNAMDERTTLGLASLIDRNTLSTERANDFEALKEAGETVSALDTAEISGEGTSLLDNEASVDNDIGPEEAANDFDYYMDR